MRGKYTDLSHYIERSHPLLMTPCWIWQGYTNGSYGVLWAAEFSGYVHRISYENHKGPIPEGMNVCHGCDTPLCINPDHLFVGTQGDNVRDMRAKGRQADPDKHWARVHPDRLRGENNGNAKLKSEDVRRIKVLLRIEGANRKDIAARFGVSRQTIGAIARGESWSHVPEGEVA